MADPVAAVSPCTASASIAERAWKLPRGLLLAIGLAESGVRDPATAQLAPARFAVNVAGSPVRFSSAQYAVDAVEGLRRRGVASIDVGCFQMNLRHHPEAFASLEEAFDARANAMAAGEFLSRLFRQTGDWGQAVAAYHSADPRLGGPYRDRVLALWRRSSDRPAGDGEMPKPRSVSPEPFDPHVLRISAAAARIPVFTLATLPPDLRAPLGFYTKP